MGPITKNHVTVVHARQSDGTNFTMPTDNTTRQAQALDAMREDLRVAEQEQEQQRNSLSRTISVQLTFDVAQFRQLLGLPPHDLFSQGIYHGYVHPTFAGQDVADIDHGAETTTNTTTNMTTNMTTNTSANTRGNTTANARANVAATLASTNEDGSDSDESD